MPGDEDGPTRAFRDDGGGKCALNLPGAANERFFHGSSRCLGVGKPSSSRKRGPIITSSGIWIPSISAFTRVFRRAMRGDDGHGLGGPNHCCGIVQMRTGDVATSGRFAESTMDKLARSKSGQVVSWCPSCHVQFTETTLPTIEKTRGGRPFEMTPFMLFLRGNLDRLRPFLRRRVDMRVALHRHPGIKGVVEAAEDILRAVPGVQ